MIGRLKEIIFTRNGEQIVSFITGADFTEEFDELKDYEVDVKISRHREPRSQAANRYMWVLCEKIAQKLSNDGEIHTKDDIYRSEIANVGVFKQYPPLPISHAKTLETLWRERGTGWVTERVDVSPDGKTVTVRCYYGSSSYNTKQMSRLLDNIVQDAQELGITTESPEQIEKLKSLWATEPRKGTNNG